MLLLQRPILEMSFQVGGCEKGPNEGAGAKQRQTDAYVLMDQGDPSLFWSQSLSVSRAGVLFLFSFLLTTGRKSITFGPRVIMGLRSCPAMQI